jgi:hypothetical protein
VKTVCSVASNCPIVTSSRRLTPAPSEPSW